MIRGLRHPVPWLSFEVTRPEFLPEGLKCVSLLGDLAVNGQFNYAVDCERGLELERRRDSNKFLQVLEHCSETAIEIFWKELELEGMSFE